MPHWTVRDISREAAAAAMRIPLNTLDVWLHRYKAPSGKRKGARIFSLQDLTILQTARQFLGPRLLAADALAAVAPLLGERPAYDDVLYITEQRAFIGSDKEWPEANFTAVHVGWVAEEITNRLETQNVAIPQ